VAKSRNVPCCFWWGWKVSLETVKSVEWPNDRVPEFHYA
jgi:hypothetical protein